MLRKMCYSLETRIEVCIDEIRMESIDTLYAHQGLCIVSLYNQIPTQFINIFILFMRTFDQLCGGIRFFLESFP